MKKKTVLITGASGGIGKEMAYAFAREDYNIVACYNENESEAIKIKDNIAKSGKNIIILKGDISKEENIKYIYENAKKAFGKIDVLINNAGVESYKLATEITTEELDYILNVNLKAVFILTSLILKDMIDKKEGVIINTSSIWGITGGSMEVAYSASKAGVIGFTKALAKEVGPCNIRVNAIAPGAIETRMIENLSEEARDMLKEETPLGIIGSGEDIAYLAVFLSSEKSRFITGQVISPNGGFVI